MILIDDYKKIINDIIKDINDVKEAISYDALLVQIEELELHTHDPNFWNDKDKQLSIFQKLKSAKSKAQNFDTIKNLHSDITVLIQMYIEDEDESLLEEIKEETLNLQNLIETLKLETLLVGEYDSKNAIVTLHAGAGGTESQDWAEMLYRMYTRYCQKAGYKTQTIDFLDGDEAGLKSISFSVEGVNAYGFLKGENGVHRLVRISPFDSSGRRHTSFASCEVMPEIDDDTEIIINSEDLKVDTFRASGAGGQHVNKTESAIRITHMPSGIVVSSQAQRSQIQNRETAMKMLRSKLAKIKEQEHLDKIEDIKGVQKEIAWGSQIRSYVFMPYTLVKDHRTSYEDARVDMIMDGNIQDFLNAYLKFINNND